MATTTQTSSPAPSSWVFVGGVPQTATEDDVKKALASLGNIASVQFRAGRQHQFVDFGTAEAAAKAATGSAKIGESTLTLEVRKSQPGRERAERKPREPREPRENSEPRQPRQPRQPKGETTESEPKPRRRRQLGTTDGAWVFVAQLPEETNRQAVKTAFEGFGEVTAIDFRRRRRYQYVQFADQEGAQKAIKAAESKSIVVDGAEAVVEARKPREPRDEEPRESKPRQAREPREPREKAPRQPREPREPREPRDDSPAFFVYVAGVPREATKDELRAAFEKFGEINRLQFRPRRGFHFIGYKDEKAAQAAIGASEKIEIGGEKVTIQARKEQTEPREPREPRQPRQPREQAVSEETTESAPRRRAPRTTRQA